LAPETVSPTFAAYDLFAFPTLGENFGHVIFESLRVGTPVLLSDRTPWRTTGDGAVIAVPLEDIDAWRKEFHRASDLNERETAQLRTATRAYAMAYARQPGTAIQNLAMFRNIALEKQTRTLGVRMRVTDSAADRRG
jgi:glycosyltransferase involved in cell wall biosynthesis